MPNMLNMKQAGLENIAQRILVYGAPKSGKTLLVGKLAESNLFEKVIWLDTEKGHATLFQLSDEALAKIQLVTIKDRTEDPIAIETVMHLFEEGKTTICEEHGKLKAKCSTCKKDSGNYIELDLQAEPAKTLIVLDSMTQTSKSALHLSAKNSKVDLASLDANEKTTFNHFGVQGMMLDKVLTDMQTINCSLAVISHETNLKMTDSKEKLTAVAGTNNFARSFPKAFDHVIRVFVSNGKHIAISGTVDNAKINAGSRYNSDVMVDGEMDLTKCWEIGEIKSKETKVKTSPPKKPSSLLALKKK